jgi:SAM-dependent methyltransferase
MGEVPATRVEASGPAEAEAVVATLHALLPPPLRPLLSFSFIRSHMLYDEFVSRLALGVGRALGLDGATRQPATAEVVAGRLGLGGRCGLVPLAWILQRLAEFGIVESVPSAHGAPAFVSRRGWPELDPAVVRERQRQHDPASLPSYVLAETVAGDYPAFLRGEASGEELLFSPRRLRLWVDYFSNANGLYAITNRIGAVALSEWLPRRPGVILELGGGLGSGAQAALERLAASGRLGEVREYRFTELVPAFLRRGQHALEASHGDVARLSFGVLDMNRPFPEQGVAPDSVAVTYAVNALHVAHDVASTLGEIRRALAPGGRLIVSECVRPPGQTVYAEFIFNLMETFRTPRLDPVHRPVGGFLTPEQWAGALGAAGFTDVRLLPDVPTIRTRVPDFLAAAIGATRPG